MGYIEYYKSHESYFWQWEEGCGVVAVPGGTTIAYRQFLQEVIEAITPQGLPRFGALVLVILATNENGKDALPLVQQILESKKYKVEPVMEFLRLLASLPSGMKKGDDRIRLIQSLFENCHNKLGINYSLAVNHIIKYADQFSRVEQNIPFESDYFLKDLRVLEVIAGKLTSREDILERMAGIPELKEELQIDESEPASPAGAKPDEFIDLLINEDKTFHIGALIRHLWGGLNIPAHSSLPSSQPLGGIADLSNKGDFDKLLISEFANDDIVFLSRLANNEALYIQREIPPSQNRFERHILIDSSLKNWGTPKIVAFAAMLAIARHPKTDFVCRCFILGHSWKEVEIGTVEELIRAQELLEPHLDAASGLIGFLTDNPPGEDKEIFLITEHSVLKQPQMLRAINEFQHLLNYCIYTDAEGGLDVYKRQQGSKRHLQRMHLPLDELWSKRSNQSKKEREEGESYEGDYPVLFYSVASEERLLSQNGERYYAVFNGNMLFKYGGEIKPSAPLHRYSRARKGWDLIYPKMPLFGKMEIGTNGKGQDVLAIYHVTRNNGFLLNLETMNEQAFELSEKKESVQVFFIDGKFCFHSAGEEWFVDPDTALVSREKGTLLGSELLDRMLRERGEKLLQLNWLNEKRSILRNIHSVSITMRRSLALNNHELQLNDSGHIKLFSGKRLPSEEAKDIGNNIFAFEDGSTVEVNKMGMVILSSSNPAIPKIFIPTTMNTTLGIGTPEEFAGNEYYLKPPLNVIPTARFFQNYIQPFIQTITDYGT